MVGRYVGTRLRRVSPAATALVEALVALGDGVDLATAAALAGLDAQAAEEVRQALAHMDILDSVDPHADPRTTVFYANVYRKLGISRRAQLPQALASARTASL